MWIRLRGGSVVHHWHLVISNPAATVIVAIFVIVDLAMLAFSVHIIALLLLARFQAMLFP